MSPVKIKGDHPVLKKRIAVSQKRQITIPIEFYNSVGIDREVECYVQNNAIIIRPVQESSGECDEQIFAELIAQGLSGQKLLDKFKETRRQVRPAMERLLDQARLAAQGQVSSHSYDLMFLARRRIDGQISNYASCCVNPSCLMTSSLHFVQNDITLC